MSKYTREQIISELHKGAVDVTFTKVDGSNRLMECTLNPTLMPEEMPTKKTDRVKKENLDVVSVWDLEANGWRSFRVENVISVDKAQKDLDL